jgi:mono/diheme cytochrome c family protein
MGRKAVRVVAGLAASLVLSGAASAQDAALIARGKYLVEGVAGCNDCHSPRNQRGDLIAGRELTGAPLLFAATVPMPWAPNAPPIRRLPPGWNQAQLASFLQTGKRPNGSETRPPMPPYRMNAADARAVAAFIASMK